jgi:membrane protease YdiL (CAAX protease family)
MSAEPWEKRRHLKLALVWAIVGALAVLAVLPFVLALTSARQLSLPPVLLVLQVLQMFLLLVPLCWVGLRLGQPIGLDSPFARALAYGGKWPPLSYRAIAAALLTAVLGGAAIIGLSLATAPLMPEVKEHLAGGIALWKRLLASFYGGITEELLLRLFLLTTIAWLIWRAALRARPSPPAAVFWIATVTAALLFGAGHLPAAAAVWPLTAVVVLRTILLNMLVGIPLGLIYCRWGLEYAMLAHFCADLVLQGSAGLLENNGGG